MRRTIVAVVAGLFITASHAAEVPENLSQIYGQVHSNVKGVMHIKIDESLPMSSLPDLASDDVGKTVRVRCLSPCHEFKVRDYITARLTKVSGEGSPYTIRRIQRAFKPPYIQ